MLQMCVPNPAATAKITVRGPTKPGKALTSVEVSLPMWFFRMKLTQEQRISLGKLAEELNSLTQAKEAAFAAVLRDVVDLLANCMPKYAPPILVTSGPEASREPLRDGTKATHADAAETNRYAAETFAA